MQFSASSPGAWRSIYFMKLPGFERKLRVALDWTLDLFFALDIVYLRPLHTAQRAVEIGIDAEEAAAESPAT